MRGAQPAPQRQRQAQVQGKTSPAQARQEQAQARQEQAPVPERGPAQWPARLERLRPKASLPQACRARRVRASRSVRQAD